MRTDAEKIEAVLALVRKRHAEADSGRMDPRTVLERNNIQALCLEVADICLDEETT